MRQSPGTRLGPLTRRLGRRWITAAAIAGTAALLPPGVSYAASQSAAAPAAAAGSCTGVTPAVFPAAGFIADPARDQGGHLWWRGSAAGASICIGTVVEFISYTTTATRQWKVIVYDASHPGGQVVARQRFTLPRGFWFWSFPVHQSYPGLRAVCITADDAFGAPCIDFGRQQG